MENTLNRTETTPGSEKTQGEIMKAEKWKGYLLSLKTMGVGQQEAEQILLDKGITEVWKPSRVGFYLGAIKRYKNITDKPLSNSAPWQISERTLPHNGICPVCEGKLTKDDRRDSFLKQALGWRCEHDGESEIIEVDNGEQIEIRKNHFVEYACNCMRNQANKFQEEEMPI